MSRTDPDVDAGELTSLLQFLDYHRATMVMKATGLSDHQVHLRPLRSANLSIAGLLKHLAYTEDLWFQQRFLGRDLPEPWASAPLDTDPEWDLHSATDESLAELLALYTAACGRSRAAAAAPLTQRSVEPDRLTGRPFTLRWVMLHLLEETARHNGHADLLREALDGATGV